MRSPTRTSRLAVLLLLAALPAAAGQGPAVAASSRPPRRIEPRAEELLKKMSSLLARTQRFALEAEETFDEVDDDSPRVALTNVRRIAVVRPNRAAADATGDTLDRAAWYDGKTLTLLDKAHNTYATLPAPDSIDKALEELAERFGVELPLADLLYADPFAVLTEGVTYGRYLGIHLAGGVPCHHLVFAQETIEWQIWIDAGQEPLPRKLVISYVDEPGEPQYTAIFRKWKLDLDLPDALFRFEAPEGAVRAEPQAIVPASGGSSATSLEPGKEK